MRNSFFTDLANRISSLSSTDRIRQARVSFLKLIEALSGIDSDSVKLYTVLLAPRLGISDVMRPLKEEKVLFDTVFSPSGGEAMPAYYDILKTPVTEDDYRFAKDLVKLGQNVTTPFLTLTLCFAYADGILEEDKADRLDALAGA